MLNATFNNMSVLLMEGTGENHRSEILYHIMLYRVHLDIIQYVLPRSDHIL